MPKAKPGAKKAKSPARSPRKMTAASRNGHDVDSANAIRRRGQATAVAAAAAARWASDKTETQTMFQHWQSGLPHDRLAHLIKHAIRALDRALQVRLADHGVSIGHWVFLRALWEGDRRKELRDEDNLKIAVLEIGIQDKQPEWYSPARASANKWVRR